LAVPIASITRFDIVMEKKRNTLKGLIVGGLSGALTEPFVSRVDSKDCSASSNYCSHAEAVGYGALGGGVVGALVGYLIKTDRWSPVALDALRRPGAPASRDGGGFSFSIAVRF
jgi:hypothetical protein